MTLFDFLTLCLLYLVLGHVSGKALHKELLHELKDNS